MLDSSDLICDHGSRRVWSLLDLLRLHARNYVTIGQMYEAYQSSFQSTFASAVNPNALPNDEQLEEQIRKLSDLLRLCDDMHLKVSARTLSRTIEEYRKKPPTFSITKQRFGEWFSCFISEIESQLYLLVLPHRVSYWTSDPLPSWKPETMIGDRVADLVDHLQTFPHAVYDAIEAGNCLAFERFTASAYHLMRVAEYGLVSVACQIGVPEDKRTSWDKMIGGIHSEVKRLSSVVPHPENWRDEEKKYSDLCAWFTTIQKGWRNPVSHVPRVYSEATAQAMFGATRTLFECLHKQGFKEQAMPPVIEGDA